MKKKLISAAIVLGALCLTGCDRVEPGNVGIKVNKLGDDKGVGEVVGLVVIGQAGIPSSTSSLPSSK